MSAFDLPGMRLLLIVSLIMANAPTLVRADDSKTARASRPRVDATIQDSVIQADGSITFKLVTAAGVPMQRMPIQLLHRRHEVARAVTNERGEASFQQVRPGIHVVQTGTVPKVVRLWKASAAPPHAVRHPALVVSADVVRGQYGPPMMAGPGILLVGAAAVAVVLAGKSSGSNHRPAAPASP